jgi:hypothetical protein
MNAQLEIFGAEPSTDDSPVGLAITLPERCPRCSACRHGPNVVRRAGEIAMTEFAIIVTELSGNKTELCRVGSNPEAVAEGARRKTILLGRSRRIPLYRRVEVVELKP